MEFKPARTVAQVDAILCAPGNLHELQTCVVDGRLQRVYKNLWPSLRVFWISVAKQHADATYIVFEHQRLTFRQVFERSIKNAAIYRDLYDVQKGDRVAICSRNYPEYLIAFWACHLIGAVPVLVNAWSPQDVLSYCLTHTQSKLIITDAERADKLEPIATQLAADAGATGIVVIEAQEGKGSWKGMQSWEGVFGNYIKDTSAILATDPQILPEDNAAILFTSGTTGLPKGVLNTQRQYLTNTINVTVSKARAALRRGENLPVPTPAAPQKSMLISVPFFHVTGTTSLTMLASLMGFKIVLMRKWEPKEATRLIKAENVTIAGGVPSMVADLIDSAKGNPLESLMFGGAPAPDSLASRARQTFPIAEMGQAYGLTETNSVAVGFSGDDVVARPASCGLPMPVNDVLVINRDISVPPGTVGEVWLRGPNVMKEYWRDPVSTNKVLTKDGWLKTGDLGLLDDEGFLYIRDRIKDIIIRGGENIDSVSVENALYKDERLLEVAAVGVPDEHLGELVATVVSVKPEYRGQMKEAEIIAMAQESLPRYAVPVMVVIQDEPFEHTASGKIIKTQLRAVARDIWLKRLARKSSIKSKL